MRGEGMGGGGVGARAEPGKERGSVRWLDCKRKCRLPACRSDSSVRALTEHCNWKRGPFNFLSWKR